MDYSILSDLIITKIYSASTMYTEEKTGSKRRNRPAWALVIKYEGETVYSSGGKSYISNINNIVILPKGCDYDWHCTKSGHFSIIEFDCQKSSSQILPFKIKNAEILLNAIKKIEINHTLKPYAYKLEELKTLYDTLLSLLKTAEKKYTPSAKENKISPAINYIAENYNKRICNEDLAAITGVSTVYFRKIFKEAMGVSPINYIQSVKMKKAADMLKSDYSCISDIAASLGYNDIYEFSKSFKKHSGIAPSQYAKRYK